MCGIMRPAATSALPPTPATMLMRPSTSRWRPPHSTRRATMAAWWYTTTTTTAITVRYRGYTCRDTYTMPTLDVPWTRLRHGHQHIISVMLVSWSVYP